MTNDFKRKYSLDQRVKESTKILKKYDDRVPIIVTKSKKSDLENIDKNKFLVPDELTLGQFLFIIRKRLKLGSDVAVFLMVNEETIPPTSCSMSSIYQEYKDEDGFLYILYCGENVFGNDV